MIDAEGKYNGKIFVPAPMKTIAETADQHKCRALILFDPSLNEWWWAMSDDELEGPFDTREDAERDLASR
jgi:hypothetical protein